MLAGYVATWSVGWALLLGVAGVARAIAPGDWAAALGLAVLVAWQASPAKQRLLNCCHAKPSLAAFGRAADLDALSLGHATARTCFATCWALMLLPLLLATHNLAVMALAAGWMWAERLDAPAAPAWRVRLPVAMARLVIARARAWARTPARAARVR